MAIEEGTEGNKITKDRNINEQSISQTTYSIWGNLLRIICVYKLFLSVAE